MVRVSLFWSIFEQSKNGISMRVCVSYPQKNCCGSCSCRSRPLVTGFTLSLGVGGGGTRGGAGGVNGTRFRSKMVDRPSLGVADEKKPRTPEGVRGKVMRGLLGVFV